MRASLRVAHLKRFVYTLDHSTSALDSPTVFIFRAVQRLFRWNSGSIGNGVKSFKGQ